MTQQDDITQRLRDNADIDEAEHGNARVVQLERDAADEIERLRAELSKLRAPVADAGNLPPLPKPALLWHSEFTNQTYYGYTADHMLDYARATLASAPVAVEHHDGLLMLLAELPGMREDPKQGDAVFRCGVNGGLNAVEGRIRELLRSAPVAGEARCVGYIDYKGKNAGHARAVLTTGYDENGNAWADGTKLYAYSAPQASAMPALNDAMRAVISNERDVYQTPDALYAALCNAALDARKEQGHG